MGINRNFFHPFYFLKNQKNTFYYRNHINFFNKLFNFIVTNKNYIFFNKNKFINYILSEIKTYLTLINKQESDISLIKFFLQKIEEYRYYKTPKIYNYLISFIGTIYFLGFYPVSIFFSANNNLSIQELQEISKQILEKYAISCKLLLVFTNQTLLKGVALSYKNNVIDLSLKKLENIIKKTLENGVE